MSLSFALLGGALCGCFPALNWREVRPEGSAAALLFPCKPDFSLRNVILGGVSLDLHMNACEAQGQVFALAYATLPTSASAPDLLLDLQRATSHNLAPATATEIPLDVPGMMSDGAARRIQWQGRRPDGHPQKVDAAYFAGGGLIYQASIVGTARDPDIAQMFFSNLRLAR